MEQISHESVSKESRGVMVDAVAPAIPESTMKNFEELEPINAWGDRAAIKSAAILNLNIHSDQDPLVDTYYIANSERESSYSVVAMVPNTTRNKNSSEMAIVTLTVVLDSIVVSHCFYFQLVKKRRYFFFSFEKPTNSVSFLLLLLDHWN